MSLRSDAINFLYDDLTEILPSIVNEVISKVPIDASLSEQVHEIARAITDKSYESPQYSLLGGRILMHELQKSVSSTFSGAMREGTSLLDARFLVFVLENEEELNAIPLFKRDFKFDYFAINTLKTSYLLWLKKDGKTRILETPQYMYLRVATAMWYPNMHKIRECYNAISLGDISPASPTLYNSGTINANLFSCYLLETEDDMEHISKMWHDTAIISSRAGGIGIDYSALRHSEIGERGYSRGIVPWLKIQNEIISTVDQGGRRKGSAAIYLCEWHKDIFEFIELRRPQGADELRARDLFYAIWMSDLFMERVKEDGHWSLFCPNRAKGLVSTWGDDFRKLYLEYEEDGHLVERRVKARDLWRLILNVQIETGMPYILFKDACNRKSNQQNLGTIRCSNLCAEIVEYTSKDEIASCVLTSISLPACVDDGVFDFAKLEYLASLAVQNLNQLIDRNDYPDTVPQIKFANLKNRPLGIGVQGLADTFALLGYAWEDDEARKLNRDIFETLYFATTKQSIELAKRDGYYPSFLGSPASNGKFQFELWDEEFEETGRGMLDFDSSRYSLETWDSLRRDMVRFGLRNSLLLALMPTASSAQILGNNESFEPFTANIYSRTVLSGQFMLINKHLVRELRSRGLWTTRIVKSIIENSGSIASLEVDERLKKMFKTIYEIPQARLLQMSLDRGRFICQTQSLNVFLSSPTFKTLNAHHFKAWHGGAKTCNYYIRQQSRVSPINFALDGIRLRYIPTGKTLEELVLAEKSGECLSCSS